MQQGVEEFCVVDRSCIEGDSLLNWFRNTQRANRCREPGPDWLNRRWPLTLPGWDASCRYPSHANIASWQRFVQFSCKCSVHKEKSKPHPCKKKLAKSVLAEYLIVCIDICNILYFLRNGRAILGKWQKKAKEQKQTHSKSITWFDKLMAFIFGGKKSFPLFLHDGNFNPWHLWAFVSYKKIFDIIIQWLESCGGGEVCLLGGLLYVWTITVRGGGHYYQSPPTGHQRAFDSTRDVISPPRLIKSGNTDFFRP